MSALLLLTFFLHLLPMNWVLGGSIVAVVARARGRAGSPLHAELARRMAKSFPIAVAAAVTFGVAPLLFVQALWGRLFFPSSVLMAWLWLAVVPILILAYYGTYRLAMAGEKAAGTVWIGAATALLFLGIAFLYVTNMSRMVRPETFLPSYLESARGFRLNLTDPTFWPRFLHFVLGAVAVGGLGVAGLGLLRRRSEGEFAAFAMRHGALWAAGATAASIVAGFAWLLLLPLEVMMRFMGGSLLASGLLGAGVLLGLAALVTLAMAINAREPSSLVRIGLVAVTATIVVMVLQRDQVRAGLLERAAFAPSPWVAPQWGVIALFGVLLAVALGTVAWMIAKARG
jgi:hypothetical protein